jgi:hypothetical protein
MRMGKKQELLRMGSNDEVELVMGKEDEELDRDGLMKSPRCYSKVSTNDKVSPSDVMSPRQER